MIYRKRKYNRGGNVGGGVGTVVGGVAGSIIPGLGTAGGATIGGAAGRLIGGLFGKKKKKDKVPPSAGFIHPPSYGMKKGGSLKMGGSMNWYSKGSVTIDGRSHEAGGVLLTELGRPDVEVEHNEVVTLNENGEPDYVFSSMQMDDKNRSFAEEYKRLEEKGDAEGIKQLMKKQERQMGRVKDVTITDTQRRAQFSKYGGSLKERYQTGGPIFYSTPNGVYPSTPGGARFISGPGGTQITGSPVRYTPKPTSIVPKPTSIVPTHPNRGPTSLVHQPRPTPNAGSSWMRGLGKIGRTLSRATPYLLAAHAGNFVAEQIMGDTVLGSYNRMRDNQEALRRATRRRQDAEFENFDPELLNKVTYQPDSGFRFYEHPGETVVEETEDAPVPVAEEGTDRTPSRVPATQPEDPIMMPTPNDILGLPIGMSDRELPTYSVSNYEANLPETNSQTPPETDIETVPVEGDAGGGGGFGWDTAAQLAPYAADLLNIGIASTMKKPKRPRAYSPAMMDERVSTTADEEALTASARAILHDPNATANQKLAATAQLNRAKNRVRSEANRRRDSIRRYNTQTLNRARELNARRDERYAYRLDRHRGAKATAISQSARSMADRVALQQAEKQQRELLPFQLTALMYSMPTKDRREYIKDLRRTLPKDDPLYRQMGLMLGGI